MKKGHVNSKEEDYKSALKNYSKAIELDSTYAEAYFSRGTIKLNDFQFDEAIVDFDNALNLNHLCLMHYQIEHLQELENTSLVIVGHYQKIAR